MMMYGLLRGIAMNLQPHDATPEGKDQSIYVSVLVKRRT